MELKCPECGGTGVILVRADTIGGKLAALRIGKGLGIRAVARAVKMSPTTLCRIENDKSENIALGRVRTLADFYGVTMGELF